MCADLAGVVLSVARWHSGTASHGQHFCVLDCKQSQRHVMPGQVENSAGDLLGGMKLPAVMDTPIGACQSIGSDRVHPSSTG